MEILAQTVFHWRLSGIPWSTCWPVEASFGAVVIFFIAKMFGK